MNTGYTPATGASANTKAMAMITFRCSALADGVVLDVGTVMAYF